MTTHNREVMSAVSKAVSNAVRAEGSWIKAADALYGCGVTVATMVDKEHDDNAMVTAAIIEGLPAAWQKLLSYDKKTMSGMAEDKKKERRTAQQRIGTYRSRLGGYLATLQENDLNAGVTNPAEEPVKLVNSKTGEITTSDPADQKPDSEFSKYESAVQHVEKAIAELRDAVAAPPGKDVTKLIKALEAAIK